MPAVTASRRSSCRSAAVATPSTAAGPTRAPPCSGGSRPRFDPLAELVGRARAAGVAGPCVAERQPRRRRDGHAVGGAARHCRSIPSGSWCRGRWSPTVLRLSPRDPRYLSTIASWSARNSATIEGVFCSPIPEGAQDRLDATIAHLTSALRARRPAPRLHPISVAGLRLQPRGARRVPRRVRARTDAARVELRSMPARRQRRWPSWTTFRRAGWHSAATA